MFLVKISTAARALGLVTRTAEPIPPATPSSAATPPARTAAPTVESALTLESVYRAVSIISTATEQLTLDTWRGRTPIAEPHPIITRPNLDTETGPFLETTAAHLATRGNAFWLVERDALEQVRQIWTIPPLEVSIEERELTRPPRYWWRGKAYSSREIRHLAIGRGLGPGAYGLGPLQAWIVGIWGAVRTRDYAALWFDSAGVPNGILSTDQHLTAEMAQAYKAQWHASMKGDETAVLGAGLEYRPLMLKPSEIQWIESRNTTATEVARLFGIPGGLMLTGSPGSSLTYKTAETDNLQFIRWTLIKYLREIETAFSAVLPRGQVARFNLDAILRADTKTRYEAHKIALDSGFRTVEEIREIEGWAPLPAAPVTEEIRP